MSEFNNKDMEVIDDDDPRAYLWSNYQRYPYILAKFTLFAAIFFIILYLLGEIESVLFPIFISLLIAYLLDPLAHWFEKRGISRTVSILIIILALILMLALFTLVLYPTFERIITVLTQKVPQLGHLIFDKFFPWIEHQLGFKLPGSIAATLRDYRTQIESQIPTVLQRVTSAATDLLTRSRALLTSLVNMVMIPVFSFYFLRDFSTIRRQFLSLVPRHNNNEIMKRLHRMDTVVGAWFRGQLTVSAILAGLYSLGLGTVFGISGVGFWSGLGVGMLTGFLNIIPYFGVTTGFVISILMVVLNWSAAWPLMGVCTVFLIVQLMEGYYITPKIVGNAVGLSPVVVIIVLLIGGASFGLIGVLIATPIAGVVKVLLPDLLDYYKRSSFYTGKYVATPYPKTTKNQELILPSNSYKNKEQSGEESASREKANPLLDQMMNDTEEIKEDLDRLENCIVEGVTKQNEIITDSSILSSDDPRMQKIRDEEAWELLETIKEEEETES